MQSDADNSKCDVRSSELNEIGKEQLGSSSPLSGNLCAEGGQSLTSLQSNLEADLSESDNNDVSEESDSKVASMVEGSKFLLADDVKDKEDYEETRGRINAFLPRNEVSKLTLSKKETFADPKVLEKLTLSVSLALDEAAAALNRMRTEPDTSADPGDGVNSILFNTSSQK